MENKVNVAELLKGCTPGMELDCVIWDNCTFEGIEDVGYINILVKTPNGLVKLSKEGYLYHNHSGSKCAIFPKGKTTWEGFVPPCKFKDGDIVATDDGWIGITTGGEIGKFMPTYCVIRSDGEFEAYLDTKETWQFYRLATEGEKEKLFDAIKENGYKWNSETKTLEKLMEPNFKDGDILSSRYGNPFILKAHLPKSDSVSSYCALDFDDNFQEGCNRWASASGCRYATEEEKQKLFDAIKANGYKWNAETKILEKLEDVDDKGNISDGYHTFNELYEYRLLYNASMFNELAKQGLYDVHKSKRHSDGTIPFGDENWFIVQAELPTGQISNHYEMKEWDLFNIPEKEKANTYDGHSPQDVAKRLRDFLSLEKLVKSKFKDGDIIFTHANCLKVGVGNTWISIFKEIRNGGVATYVDCCENEVDYYDDLDGDKPLLCMESDILRQRLATEEEKVKLFNKIQEHGYRWNNESKTLEKLIVPKFKVGDRVKHKQSFISGVITNIDDDCYKIKYDSGAVSFAIIKDQDDWELVSDEIEPKFKVEDKIRLKGNPNYIYTITGIKENKSGCGVTFDLRFSEQDKNWNWFPKFDISTLVPFESRVLVRNAEEDIWKPAIFGCYADKTSRYYVLGGTCWSYCIPYEGNENLCGKKDDCKEYYKTWE